jgi:hypothetical protein
MADKVQEAATADITAWTSTMRSMQLEHRPGSMQERIAIELTRIRHEMTAIRQLSEARKNHIDGGSF